MQSTQGEIWQPYASFQIMKHALQSKLISNFISAFLQRANSAFLGSFNISTVGLVVYIQIHTHFTHRSPGYFRPLTPIINSCYMLPPALLPYHSKQRCPLPLASAHRSLSLLAVATPTVYKLDTPWTSSSSSEA